MSLQRARVAIVGGGLSGLTAAWLLAQQGIDDVVLLESRSGLGGRILSVDAHGAAVDATVPAIDRFDLGPTWFWPAPQPQLDHFVAELGLARFPQFDEGDVLVERTPHQAPLRVQGYPSAPASMRWQGGHGGVDCGAPPAAGSGQLAHRAHRVQCAARWGACGRRRRKGGGGPSHLAC